MTSPTESPAGTGTSTGGPDHRRRLLIGTGAIVAVALVGVLLATVFGGSDDDKRPEAPVVRPLALTSPVDTSGIIGVDGQPTQPPQADLDAILAAVTGYLKDATVTPLSTLPDDGVTTTAPAGNPLAAHFGPVAAGSLQGTEIQALSDAHLGFAEGGVATEKLTVALAGIVQDGATQYVDATIDVLMVVRGDQDVTIARTGNLVLRPLDGSWKITAYRIDVTRTIGSETTTSEAAFG
ncbi:MAG TPA: hypothetical protein VI916_01280 [Acidimicrobiia bacterium]|nr:hypothetical protein [Acidimicrobiia bacterium]